jgi:cysteine synthase A
MRTQIPADSNCVLIFPDAGDRYLRTIYCDDWVRRNFGYVPETKGWR